MELLSIEYIVLFTILKQIPQGMCVCVWVCVCVYARVCVCQSFQPFSNIFDQIMA